ncbi:MAG: DUF484 family protein [Proteobacteria bacterium]|nr:DUF484 family protein [Pseudomonadota bacterium]
MTSVTSSGSPEESRLDENEVAKFLRSDPTFLDKHPELLRDLSISHGSGDAVSLLERQVVLLRSENTEVKTRLEELVSLARENETLNHKIHDLVLTLMNAVGPQAIFSSLERCLANDFSADKVFSYIFAEPAFIDSGEVPEFVGTSSAKRAAFAGVIESARTVCGPLSAEQRLVLFGGEERDGSAVVMPLNGNGWDGVLIVNSNDTDRYEADMGTEFLTYLSDVVTLVLDPWVKRPKLR